MNGPMVREEGNYPWAGSTYVRELAVGDDLKSTGMNEREPGRIAQNFSRLDLELDRLDHAVSDLLTKISPVLHPETQGEMEDDGGVPQQSKLAMVISDKSARVLNLTQILEDVIRRVEL